MKFMKRHLLMHQMLLIICIIQVPTSLLSQNNKQERMGPPLWTLANSPEIHGDGMVSFRIWAPKANEVTLESELFDGKSLRLTKGDNDIWSLTVTPPKAGLFQYRFLVDGVITVDPTNAITYGNSNLLFIKGNEADFFTAKQVPHGTIHQHLYYSHSIGAERSFHVYTPPDYFINSDKTYPVLFLLHGSGETDASWTKMGKAHIILDNLIAQGLAKPMIVIMPYGHTVEPGTSGWPFVQERGDFIQDFFEELVPYAENLYRISPQSKDRAIAGFSMGAYHTLIIGLNHLDQFAHLGVFSWGADKKWIEENVPAISTMPENVNLNLKLFWIACGKDDFLFKRAQEFNETLTDLHINHTFTISEGGHSMINWREYLYQYTQLIFK